MKKTLLAAMAMVSLCGYAQFTVESFESPWVSPGPGLPAAPPGWTVINESGIAVTWLQSVGNEPDSPPYGGNHAAFLQRENVAPTVQIPKDWLISPAFQVPLNAQIRFFSRLTINEDQGGIYKVYVGTNPADLSTFTEIYSATEMQINPVQTQYMEKFVTIPPTYANQQLHIAFVMEGDNADRWFIDDVGIFSTCDAPIGLTATNVDLTSVEISWTETGEATQWEVEVVPETSVPTGYGVIVTDSSYVISSLTPGVVYKVYVRSICSDGGRSSWTGPLYFPEGACPKPTNVTLTSSGLDTKVYSWTATGAQSYDYWITSVPGQVPDSATVPTGVVVEPTATLTGLSAGQDYKFYVRSVCDTDNVSLWSGYPDIPVSVSNSILGTVFYDSNNDGICNEDDDVLPYTEVQVAINDISYSTYTDLNGQYYISGLVDGTYALNFQVVSSAFASIAPLTQEVTFNEEVNTLDINYCAGQPLAVSDLEVTFIAMGQPRPGFNTNYSVVVQNKGSLPQEDVVLSLSFDNNRLSYVESGLAGATATGATVSIPLGDIQAFSSIGGSIVFHTAQPPVNMGGEIVHFEASLSAVPNDITPDDNEAVLNPIIVNSFDPNDITVHEGAKIYEEQADEYLTYTIRFQNTGTAEAINIKLENTLDDLLDWSTFKPITSSHSYTVKRTDNILEFEYKDIFLPDSTANEPDSHGLVTYKIKPKAEYGLDDTVYNTAEIYFDFNPAIVTNIAETKVIAMLGLNDNAVEIARLYPNPVKDQLFVEVKDGELRSVAVYDINGRLCLSANTETIDTNSLNSGIYFVKVTTDMGSANYKIIKH